MNYPIPDTPEDISALKKKSVTEEIVAIAIAGVVQLARQQGRSLEDLQAEILKDDLILDIVQRRWLRDLIIKAWEIV